MKNRINKGEWLFQPLSRKAGDERIEHPQYHLYKPYNTLRDAFRDVPTKK